MATKAKPSPVAIPLADLRAAYDTLGDCLRNWNMGSHEFAALVEARRLVEVEIKEQHGSAGWHEVMAEAK